MTVSRVGLGMWNESTEEQDIFGKSQNASFPSGRRHSQSGTQRHLETCGGGDTESLRECYGYPKRIGRECMVWGCGMRSVRWVVSKQIQLEQFKIRLKADDVEYLYRNIQWPVRTVYWRVAHHIHSQLEES